MSTAYNRDAFADLMGQLALQAQEGSTTFTGGGFGKSSVGVQGVGRPMSQASAIREFQQLPEDVQADYVNQITDPNARMEAANTLGVSASFNSGINPQDFRFYDPNTFSSAVQNPFSTISDRQLNILGGNDFFQNLYDAGAFFEGVPNAGTGVGPAPGPVLNFDTLPANNAEQITVTGRQSTDPNVAMGAGNLNLTPGNLDLGGVNLEDEEEDERPIEEILVTGVRNAANTLLPGLSLLSSGYDFVRELPEGDFTPDELAELEQANTAANVFVDSQPTYQEGGTGTTTTPGGVNVPGLGIGSLGGSRGFVGTQDVLVPATGQMGDIYSIRPGDTRGGFAAPSYVNPYADVAAQDTAFRPGFVRTLPLNPIAADPGTTVAAPGTTVAAPGTTVTAPRTTGRRNRARDLVDTTLDEFERVGENDNIIIDTRVGANDTRVGAEDTSPRTTVTPAIDITETDTTLTPAEILAGISPDSEGRFSRDEINAAAGLLTSGDIGIGNLTELFDVSPGDVIEELLRGGYQTPTQLTEMIQGYGNEGFQEQDLIADLLNQGRTTADEVASYYRQNRPEFSDLTPEAVTARLRDINMNRLQGLSDVEVGRLIDSSQMTPGQAVQIYQDRYPGLTESDVNASLNQMRSQSMFAMGGVVEKGDGIESLLDRRQQAVNRMLSKRAGVQLKDGGMVDTSGKKPSAVSNFAGGGIATKLIQKGAELLGFDDDRQIEITREAVDLTNQMVDAGLVDPKFRVNLRLPKEGEPATRQNTGIEGDEEVFNAVNHALFSYHAGKSPLARAGSQAKEIYQGIRLAGAGKDPGSESLDYFNNMFGFDLARQGLSPEEAKNAIIDNIANINNQGAMSRLRAGEPLIAGKDLSRTAEDIRGSGPDVSAFDVLAGVQGLKDGGPPDKVPASVLEGRGSFYGTPYREEPKVDTGQSNLTLQQRLDQATPLEQYAYEVLGLEPGLDRGMMTPVAIRQSGDKEFALPALAYDSLKALLAPGAALSGRQVTPEETIELAMETMGSGLATPGVDIGTDVMAGMAAKPKGGVFFSAPYESKDFLGSGDYIFLDAAQETIPLEYGHQLVQRGMDPELADIVSSRVEGYFKKLFGTGSDPLRIKILEGQIDPDFYAPETKIPEEVLKQAREDYAASKTDPSKANSPSLLEFERLYDQATRLTAQSSDQAVGSAEASLKMLEEGVPLEAQNPPYVYPIDEFEITDDVLENPTIARALEQGDTIYDIQSGELNKGALNVVLPNPEKIEGIMSIPPNKLKNMSFPEMIAFVEKNITGANRKRRNYEQSLASYQKENNIRPGRTDPEIVINQPLPDPEVLLKHGVEPVVDSSRNNRWFRITDPDYTTTEGLLMNHSVGGYARSKPYGVYAFQQGVDARQKFIDGDVRVFSLRNKETGRPSVTVDMDFSDPDRPKFHEVEGPSNADLKPQEYDDLFTLFEEVGVFVEDLPMDLKDLYRNFKERGTADAKTYFGLTPDV